MNVSAINRLLEDAGYNPAGDTHATIVMVLEDLKRLNTVKQELEAARSENDAMREALAHLRK